MSGHTWSEESPDPRFNIEGYSEEEGTTYFVIMPSQDEDTEGDELEMPNGERSAAFQFYSDAVEFVEAMVKCLDEGFPWREELDNPDKRFKLFECKGAFEVEMANGEALSNGAKIVSFKQYWDAIRFIFQLVDRLPAPSN